MLASLPTCKPKVNVETDGDRVTQTCPVAALFFKAGDESTEKANRLFNRFCSGKYEGETDEFMRWYDSECKSNSVLQGLINKELNRRAK